MTKTVKINGKEYLLSDFNAAAKSLMRNIEVADAKLRQLKQEAAMVSIARDVYGKSLVENLPEPVPGGGGAKPKLNG